MRRRVVGRRIAVAVVLLALGAGVPSDARRRTPDRQAGSVTVARLRWGSGGGGSRFGFGAAWNHDYPRAEQHLSRIASELTNIDIRTDSQVIVGLDDPALFDYPLAFMWEPGFWQLTDREAASFRDYLLKGGFAVFEDFDGPSQWQVFEAQMRRVLPDHRLVELDQSHPIFDTFFRIEDIAAIRHPMSGLRPRYFGIFEGNDPAQRLMAVANFDNDVPEYLGMVGAGIVPVRHLERGLQARRQLPDLRPDPLTASDRWRRAAPLPGPAATPTAAALAVRACRR